MFLNDERRKQKQLDGATAGQQKKQLIFKDEMKWLTSQIFIIVLEL